MDRGAMINDTGGHIEDQPDRHVEALLDYAEGQASRAEKATRAVHSEAGSPEVFPGYATVRRIKSGGQGVVYEAIHQSTKRTVAIKVVRESMRDDPDARARLAREVEVLSQLRHPNIVRVTDGGEVDGRQYLVTDHIAGKPLDLYLSSGHISICESVELFATICEAVSAAHIKGVVHRDLKPSNILIDDQGQPHVLDFGLAKLIASDDDAASHWRDMTVTGQFVGSLPWATPEQVDGDSGGIDVRTDVYALGVILYHMLTERFPYDVSGTTRTVMNHILYSEPNRPSAIATGIDGDLDTIALKCLSKEPQRRYQSVGELARDARRFLNGEPIEARRDSTWYILTKTVRRHRAVAAGLATLLLMTAVYAATATMWYQRAKASEEHAHQRFLRARDALATMVDTAARLGRLSGASSDRRMLIMKARDGLETMQAGDEVDAIVKALIADTSIELGGIAQDTGDLDEAEAHLREGLVVFEHLAAGDPDNSTLQSKLSIALVRVGDVVKERDDLQTANAFYDRALGIDEDLVLREPADMTFRDNLLWSYERSGALAHQLGELAVARDFFAKQRALGEELANLDPENNQRIWALRAVYGQQMALARQVHEWARADDFAQDCVNASRRLVESEPDNSAYLESLVAAYHGRLYCLQNLDPRDSEDERWIRADALAIAERLVRDEPADAGNMQLLAGSHRMHYFAARAEGRLEPAIQHLNRALALCETIVNQSPDASNELTRLLAALRESVNAHAELDRMDQAMAHRARAVALAEDAITNGSANNQFLLEYAKLLAGPNLDDRDGLQKALEVCTRAAEGTRYADIGILEVLSGLQLRAGRADLALDTLQAILDLPGVEGTPLGHTIEGNRRRILDEASGS